MNTGYTLLLLVIIAGGLWFLIGQAPEPLTVPIQSEFDSKIVYTLETSTSTALFIADCNTRGGTFNECGTTCDKDAEACPAVCAFTCELPAYEAMMEDGATSTPEDGAMMEVKDADVTISLTGRNFAYSHGEIKVKEGDTVTINFESTDGFHDLVIDELEAKTGRVNKGEKTSVTFVADKKGTYEYYCSVGDHREKGMVGTLIVE